MHDAAYGINIIIQLGILYDNAEIDDQFILDYRQLR